MVVAAVPPAEPLNLAAAARLVRYRQLFGGARFEPATYFGSYPMWLPFRLGESQADAAVPYVFSDELVLAAEGAAQELLDLLRRRKEGEPSSEQAVFLETQPRRLPPPRLYPGRLTEGSFLFSVAARGLRSDPLLDAGLVEAWLSRGTHAALFVELAHGLVSQALETDLNGGVSTPYLYAVALAFAELVESLKRFPKAVQIRGVSYDRLEKAVGLAFFIVLDELFERVLQPLAGRGLPFETDSYALRVRLALNPLAYCSIRKSVLFNDLNPYASSTEWTSTVEPLFADLLGPDSDPRGMESRLQKLLLSQKQLAEAAESAGRVQYLREAVLEFLTRFDAFDADLTAKLVASVSRDEDLVQLPRHAKELLAQTAPLQHRKLGPLEQRALSALRASLRGEFDKARLISFAAASFLALTLDRFAVEHLDHARARLRNRRGEFQPARIEAEYQEGKLYRFAGGGQPFLKSASRVSQGHLFIDLKGFTQRTYRAKEVVMAEFMRQEFYAPILRAARVQLAQPAADGQPALTLQNLLGDAAVFSGDVRALVRLARDIQQHLASYAEKLRARMGPVAAEAEAKARSVRGEAEEKALRLQTELSMLDAELTRKRRLPSEKQEELLWDLVARRAFALERKRSEAELAGLGAEADRLRKAESALLQERQLLDQSLGKLSGPERQALVDDRICAPERQRRAEIQRELVTLAEATRVQLRALEEEARSASGYGLEAGLFVTFGAAAERVEFDDPAFGTVKVAIAEKINEAARGTARAAAIRQKLEALLERARQRRPHVELPFGVYVDQTYSFVFSPELTALVDAAVNGKDPQSAREVAQQLADAVQADLARMMGRPNPSAPNLLTTLNDIYNVGEAFSEEAVEAFLRETRATRFAFRRGLTTNELHGDLRERFLYTSDNLELLISVPLSGDLSDALIFRLAGHVHFRGFEAKRATAVYELLRPNSAFMKLVAQHHLRGWVNEARALLRG